MKYFNKPLFWLGVILSGAGFLLWIVFTIIDITVANIGSLNVGFPTGVGILGVITVILSVILPMFINKRDKKDCDKKDCDKEEYDKKEYGETE